LKLLIKIDQGHFDFESKKMKKYVLENIMNLMEYCIEIHEEYQQNKVDC
jgi:hypothetical protein